MPVTAECVENGCLLLGLLSSDHPYLSSFPPFQGICLCEYEERGNAEGTVWKIIAGLGPIALRLAHGLKNELMHLTACLQLPTSSHDHTNLLLQVFIRLLRLLLLLILFYLGVSQPSFHEISCVYDGFELITNARL